MDDLPSGLLSLTYHLAYTEGVREMWLKADYQGCFAAFGIHDADEQARILDLNEQLGTTDAAQRDALIAQWMVLVGNDVKSGGANPQILW